MLLHPHHHHPSADADAQLILEAAAELQTARDIQPTARSWPDAAAPRATSDPDQPRTASLQRQLDGTDRPQGPYVRWLKPAIDRLAALALLLVTLPILLAGVLTVRMSMGPNVIFRQQRVGQDGRLFTVYKLRTMKHDRRDTSDADLIAMAEGRWDGTERRRTHKTDADPRHTQIGRLLRKLSIDELPQIYNVLKGDMSLVGPRPELPVVVDRHYEPWMFRRLAVRPGITGLWQVSMRGEGAMHEHVDIDLDYVDRLSLREDLRILLATPMAALGKHKGA